jgi:glycosyltransferase involved in cell wall biosynthesis
MKKKIAIISGCYYGQVKGGAELQLFILANHLKNLGKEIYYIFIDGGDPIDRDGLFILKRIKKRKLLRRFFNQYFLLDFFTLYKILKMVMPDYIIIRSGFAYVGIAAKYCSSNDCKMVWQIASRNDVLPFRPKLTRGILFDYLDKKVVEYGIKRAHYIVGQAKYQDDLLYKNYQRRCDCIVHNFHPIPTQRIEKKLPIKIIWVANFKGFKRPDLFVKLAMEFRGRDDVQFIMIGRESTVGSLKNILSEIKQAGNIDYRGELTLDQVNEIMSRSHILVHTSSLEGFPNCFIQAWMRRVPVVSLDIDPDDMIKDNRIGFHSGNFEQMVKDVYLLISNQDLREEMGKRAEEFAVKNFSLDNIKKIIELIQV